MTTRKLTISWEKPTTRRTAHHLSGREYIEAKIAGKIPRTPMSRLMGFDLTEVGDGKVVIECTPSEQHLNLIGSAHGGLACTLLDSAMGAAIQSTLPAGLAGTTLELKINFVRAITLDTGKLRCEGRAIHPGRRIATSEGRLVDSKGKLYAHGTTTMLIFSLHAERP